jgi:hypothetical protein
MAQRTLNSGSHFGTPIRRLLFVWFGELNSINRCRIHFADRSDNCIDVGDRAGAGDLNLIAYCTAGLISGSSSSPHGSNKRRLRTCIRRCPGRALNFGWGAVGVNPKGSDAVGPKCRATHQSQQTLHRGSAPCPPWSGSPAFLEAATRCASSRIFRRTIVGLTLSSTAHAGSLIPRRRWRKLVQGRARRPRMV